MTSVFYAFRDASQRRRALQAPTGSAERYALYGLDELRARGLEIRHNLERTGQPPAWSRTAGSALKRALEGAGGYGGDFATVLASRRTMNRADVVFSTVDTVGIPLMLLKRAGLVRPPVVYAAIGLPERIARLRSERMRRLYASALGSCTAVIAYSEREANDLRDWLASYGHSPRVEFVPFGVDPEAWRPSSEATAVDVVSVGADSHRDFDLLVRVASRMPAVSFRIVTTQDRARTLQPLPQNIALETDIPFGEMRRRLEEARVVALPVLENSYSGATTVLLQAMALAKPVVVSRTSAIASGYGLVDGDNCRLVPPGDGVAFESALAGVLGDDLHARTLAAGARATVERDLTFRSYVDRIQQLLTGAAGGRAPSGSEAP